MTARPLHPTARRHRQRGVYAMEYALVFLVFFVLIYTTICYGLLFTFRFALQNAAEDGARASLRYQPTLVARESESRRVALAKTEVWLPTVAGLTVEAAALQLETGGACVGTWELRCSMVVTVTATDFDRVLPPFPGIAMPNSLVGRASVMLEEATLCCAQGG